jgi:2-polyprenyl-3-methyl-5-hydroxy-6-metoxy-1,4-benzoquinol methylase
VKTELTELIVCPDCGADLRTELTDRSGSDIVSGVLVCVGDGHRFPIRDSIPRFVASDQYADAFALEWNSFRTDHLDSFTGLDYLDTQLQSCLTFPLDELSGKLVLDAGCGLGRFTEICLNHGARVVAVDLSGAIDAAYQNLRHRTGVHFIQADIFRLPLKQQSFDFVYSWGVLHHTPDPPTAFAQLPPLVKPGGRLMTFVYSSYNKAYLATTELYRKLTTRLPQKLLLRLCYVAVPLYYVSKIPLVGPFITRVLLPVSVRPPTHRWRVGNTFDLYSPTYAFTYDHVEVYGWFRKAGLAEITPVAPDSGVTYVARRPE